METGDSSQGVQRLTWFAGVILLWGALILTKLVYVQVIKHADYARRARHQQEQKTPIPVLRGSIIDRSGEVLAESVWRESVYINPLRVPDLGVAADILSGILNLDRNALYGRMKSSFEQRRGFLWVAHKIEPGQAARLHGLPLDWIQFVQEGKRNYPGEAGAAHVIGSVDFEGKGEGGLERSQDTGLRGEPGSERVLRDGLGRALESQIEAAPRPGRSITVSIDERIQFIAEHALEQAVQEAHAESGSVVVMEPSHGDIYALASYPGFEPGKPPARGQNLAARSNHAISVPFEPGSVFKVITYSAAVETIGLTPETSINCGRGVLRLGGRTIHEAHGGYGTIPAATAFAKSSNIGAIVIGRQVGENNMFEYLRRFGIGSRTSIPLPAESHGMLRKLSRWRKNWTLASVSMGHEVGVTTLQLAQVCAAVANGGLLVRPRLILKQGNQAVAAEPPHRILKPQTAITMRKMMEGVVLFGTGKRAKLDGYSTGGKTGSAQIYDFAAHRYTHSYNASFMGFAPVTNPAIVVVVTLNGTHGTSGFGGAVAAPVFRVVAAEALRVLDVPRDLPDSPAPSVETQVADLDDASIPDLSSPEPGMVAEAPAQPVVTAAAQPAPPAPKPAGPAVPNFEGMSKRDVVEQAEAQGIPVLLVGSGMVRKQEPQPGGILHPGERILVEFVK